ncbi:hypothetical protein Nans01_48460 [Nocardiopsis ansamitocini]|uniref:Thymidylate kinase n=1 Tax=Nocardiopsis ansamitocini TaxID=1670832 RepID=A0A9W6ULX3_9ACTN|nr:hypothetical protein Nans01_48460 [Nocardiopsis ansamitocini]
MLSSRPFRRLWTSLALSSLGDWLSLLALVSLAAILTQDSGPTAQYFAISGVIALKLLPAVLLSPVADALTDRLDRRLTMAVATVVRGLLYLSIPLVGRLDWLLIANFLAECVALFWGPAKDSAAADLVPQDKRRQADRAGLLAAYGSAPVAALLFAVLSALSLTLGGLLPVLGATAADLALYAGGVTFLVAASVVWGVPVPERTDHDEEDGQRSLPRVLWDGVRFSGTTPLARGLLLGMLGAFAAAGMVVGVARVLVAGLGAGNAGFAVVFGALFAGALVGLATGHRLVRRISRRRLFGLALGTSGIALLVAGLVPDLVLTAVLVAVAGLGAGAAWRIGLTLLGDELEEDIRSRTFAFLYAAAGVKLLAAAVVAPLLAALIGSHTLAVGTLAYDFRGADGVLLIAAVVLLVVAFVAQRQVDDERDVSLLAEVTAALRGAPARPDPALTTHRGLFLVLEGGEGAGKSTQTRQLAIWLREEGFDVLTTREPGATKVGMRLRALLLDKENTGMSPRAEALLYAADRAEHVDSVIRPALERGAIVISDRYVDSTLAYQGAGRELVGDEIKALNGWATGELVPDLTILLDLPVGQGMQRHGRPADRLEAEPDEFHERVRKGFSALAEREPERYLVLDAQDAQATITRAIRRRVRPLLPDPVPGDAEEITGMIPIIRD